MPDDFSPPATPDDLYVPADLDDPDGPQLVDELDYWDAELDALLGRDRSSKVDTLEWELWDGVDQDEAERAMLRRDAPAWVFLPPGGNLAAALEETRPQAMSPIALIELMKATTRLSGWVEALKAAAMASFYRQRQAEHRASPRPTQIDNSGRPIDPERSWYGEIALALGLSKDTIGRRVGTALLLTGPLSATNAALKCGALTWGKALAISEATRNLSPETAQAVEAHVLKRASSQTHANLLKSLRTQVAKHTTREAADNHRAAVTERTCKIVPLADGMAGLWVVHTSDKIQQMWVAIQALATLAKRPTATDATATTEQPTSNRRATDNPAPANGLTPARISPATTPTDPGPTTAPLSTGPTSPPARTGPGMPPSGPGPAATVTDPGLDPGVTEGSIIAAPTPSGDAMKDVRTAEQRRADATADLFKHIVHNGLDWLGRRLPDQHRRRPHIEVVVPATTLLGLNDDPGELTGYGPIPADLARRIAADGTWRRILTDPINGSVLEASTTRHDPGALVTETLLARHPVCAWPGCNHSSRDCDRDHVIPFARSGTTSLAGLAPYCEYHHVIKDTLAWGWKTTSRPDGSITLTTPTGHRYTTVPPARGPTSGPSSHGPTTQPAVPEATRAAGPQLPDDAPTTPHHPEANADPPPF